MAPNWMQTEGKRDEERFNLFKAVSTNGGNYRIQKNRTILNDKEDPPRSIFNTGSVRHNIIDDPEIALYNSVKNFSRQPVRLIEWKEDSSKQPYDKKKITSKIGHPEK